jgi:hypothetical protein
VSCDKHGIEKEECFYCDMETQSWGALFSNYKNHQQGCIGSSCHAFNDLDDLNNYEAYLARICSGCNNVE